MDSVRPPYFGAKLENYTKTHHLDVSQKPFMTSWKRVWIPNQLPGPKTLCSGYHWLRVDTCNSERRVFKHQVHIVSFSKYFPDRKKMKVWTTQNTSDTSPFLASLHFSQTEMSSNCSSSCGLKHVQFFFLNTCQRIGQFTKTSCHLLANPPKRSNSSLIKWTPKNKAWLGEPENGPPGREKVPFRNQKFQVSAGSFSGEKRRKVWKIQDHFCQLQKWMPTLQVRHRSVANPRLVWSVFNDPVCNYMLMLEFEK